MDIPHATKKELGRYLFQWINGLRMVVLALAAQQKNNHRLMVGKVGILLMEEILEVGLIIYHYLQGFLHHPNGGCVVIAGFLNHQQYFSSFPYNGATNGNRFSLMGGRESTDHLCKLIGNFSGPLYPEINV